MKIFGGLLALAAFSSAQDIANERRKNNKNKKNNNRGKYASKVRALIGRSGTGWMILIGLYFFQGDPHFIIDPPTRPPICFDINPNENVAQLKFLSDPESGLSLIGNTEPSAEHKGKTFVTKVMVNAPSGVIVEFDKNCAHVNKAGVTEKITGHGQLDGFEYEVKITFHQENRYFRGGISQNFDSK